ncbi:MAG: hypothetical protein HOE78_16575 [Gammaproteobacteria bacterium]|nr:hypothetical protein [Gammaproteobacteria bacterium]
MEMTLERQKKALTGELLAQQNNLFENFKNVILNPAQILTAGIDFIEGKAGLQNIIDNAVILSLIVGFSLMVIVLLKRWL